VWRGAGIKAAEVYFGFQSNSQFRGPGSEVFVIRPPCESWRLFQGPSQRRGTTREGTELMKDQISCWSSVASRGNRWKVDVARGIVGGIAEAGDDNLVYLWRCVVLLKWGLRGTSAEAQPGLGSLPCSFMSRPCLSCRLFNCAFGCDSKCKVPLA
jgi:hypothetical protein